jgi:hypothetical protein
MSRLGSRFAAPVALALALATAAPVRAEEPALQLFAEGRALMKDGDYDGAARKFAESERIDPQVGTLANLAGCEERLDRLSSARSHWREAVALAKSRADGRLDRVSSELLRLDAVVPRLVVVPDKEPQDLRVFVDGVAIERGALGVPLPVDPGHHVVTWAAGDARGSASADASRNTTSRVELHAIPDKGLGAARAGARSWVPVGIAVSAVGAVALGVGVGFAVRASTLNSDSNAPGSCIGNACTAAGAAVRNDARTAGDIATALVISGALLATAGVAMWYLGSREGARRYSATLAPVASARGGGLSLVGSW